jgi:hypothetical protein
MTKGDGGAKLGAVAADVVSTDHLGALFHLMEFYFIVNAT